MAEPEKPQRKYRYPEQPPRPRRYLLANKPYDVLSEFNDGEGRLTLASFVPVTGLEPAGRLDQDSEGLLLLTDDGELAHRLTHPSYHVPKTYLVQVEGAPDKDALEKLRRGVLVKGETTASAEVELLERVPDLPPRDPPVRSDVETSWLRVVIREGKKRQIRHMTASLGHPTLRLVRVAIGPLTLRGLAPGEWRDVEGEELAKLNRVLRSTQDESAAPRRAPARSHKKSR
ncbi:MAG: rRNA pseudouridine synthase [Anaerolineae bacterium]|jgi:23S rRNA pseudouridine2457 synthase|nr:rRNA pseudouridine synthase [Anaerolineae bacterium]